MNNSIDNLLLSELLTTQMVVSSVLQHIEISSRSIILIKAVMFHKVRLLHIIIIRYGA